MISFAKRMWAAAPVATVILGLALGATGYFGVKMTADWVYWNDPAHQDQPIVGWMTPRYVAHSWDVPREVMVEALDLGEPGSGPRSLKRIAAKRGMTLEALIAEIEAAIAAHRATQTGGASE